MATEKQEPNRITCGTCGQVHVTSDEILNNKLSLGWSYSLIAYATGLSPRWIRNVIKGKRPISCRTSLRLKKWQETARPNPWLYSAGIEKINKESILTQKHNGKTGIWLLTDTFAFPWKLFQCRGCKGLFVGLSGQVRCIPCNEKEDVSAKSRKRRALQKKALNSLKGALRNSPLEILEEQTEPPQS